MRSIFRFYCLIGKTQYSVTRFGRSGVTSVLFESNGLTDQWHSPITLWYDYADGRKFHLAVENSNGTINLVFRSIAANGTVLREDRMALNRTI